MNESRLESERARWRQRYLQLMCDFEAELPARVSAHVDNIDEYLLRWLGYVRLETVNPQHATENSLFVVVDAASSVANSDVVGLTGTGMEGAKRAWHEYRCFLEKLRTDPRNVKTEAEETYGKFRVFADAFRDANSKR